MAVDQDYISLLQDLPIFGGISREVVELILERSPIVTRNTGGLLFREGDPADAMYVLEAGQVAVVKEWQGNRYLLRRLRAGESIGEMAMIDMQPRSASVIAEEPSMAIQIRSVTFQDIYHFDTEQFALIQMNMAREISRRLRQTDDELFRLGMKGLVPEGLPLYDCA